MNFIITSRYFLILFLVSLGTMDAWAQQIRVQGRVTDADTEEGIPFANVYVPGTTVGVATDVDGIYEIVLKSPADTLVASAVGYGEQRKFLSKDTAQTINFVLGSSSLDLEEVVVIAGENPANRIVRGIVENKEQNRIEALQTYQTEEYSKVELDLENIPQEWQERKLFKPFDFVFENIDSTSDEKPFLPVYLNETVADIFYVKSEGKPKNVVRAQQVSSGTTNKTIIEFIKRIYTEYSIYDNWVYVLDRPFASPFNNSPFLYYKYYIIDSTRINGQWSYKLKFKPKRKQELTFYGDFWVADTTFAVQRVNMRMSEDANINLVGRVIAYHEFGYQEGHWLPQKEKFIVDFTTKENAPGMIGRRTATYKDYRINQQDIVEYYQRSNTNYNAEQVEREDPDFWQKARHEPLSESEEAVYAIVDSVQNLPIYRTYVDILGMLLTGYKELGPIEIGSYASLVSFNPVEGFRTRLGVWTSDNLSTKFRVGGYLAYGFDDERFKYGADFQWNLSKTPRIILGGAYKQDISWNSENSEEFEEGNLFSGSFRRPIIPKLIFVEEGKVFYERYWGKGWSNRLTLLNRKMDPYGNIFSDGRGFNFQYLPDPETPTNVDTTIATTELIFKTRYAFDEIFVDGDFSRVSLGSKYPIVELQYALGVNGLGGDYTYHKLSLSYRHYVYLNPLGWLSYRFKAGKTFGTLPFLLLEVHPGNEGYFWDGGAFNTMNNYEFVSDTYAALLLEHHFEGFFLNKIPLLRKLKLREVVTFKAVMGSMTDANRAANQLNLFEPTDEDTFPGFRTPSDKPYLEAGVGLENIFKVFRLEALWRLNYLDNPQASRFNLRLGVDFYF